MVAQGVLLSLIVSLLLCGCADSNTVSSNGIYVTGIYSTGTDAESGEFCSDFNLSVSQARKYFSTAEIISIKEMHDSYSYLPCFVKGRCILNSEDCEWEIRAGGTGILTTKNDRFLFGCEDCF